jgi:hypothetical protein
VTHERVGVHEGRIGEDRIDAVWRAVLHQEVDAAG